MRLVLRSLALAVAAGTVYACADSSPATAPSAARARDAAASPGHHRQYGTPVRLGNGRARTYVVLDQRDGGRALELGVALDEQAMEGLPAHGHGDGPHGNMVEYLLPMPAQGPSAFKFVELDWNPAGHGVPYEAPHFDFHFYTITRAERDAIDPANPNYAAEAANAPADAPPFFADPAALLGVPAAAVAIPRMGMHWIDLHAPELQGFLGNPAGYRPFTTTFIYGAWNGRFTFMEPMITRAYIMGKRDAADPAARNELIPITTSPTYPSGNFRPDAYRIAYDEQAREYRIALVRRD